MLPFLFAALVQETDSATSWKAELFGGAAQVGQDAKSVLLFVGVLSALDEGFAVLLPEQAERAAEDHTFASKRVVQGAEEVPLGVAEATLRAKQAKLLPWEAELNEAASRRL